MSKSTFKNQVSLYYALIVMKGAYYITIPIVFFYWSRFFSISTVAILLESSFMVYSLLDVPTSALGDFWKKRYTLLLGFSLAIVALITIWTTDNRFLLILGVYLSGIGITMVNGPDGALQFQTIEKFDDKKGTLWKKFEIRKALLNSSFPIIFGLLGTFLYNVNFKLPYMLFTLMYIGAFIVVLFLKEGSSDELENQTVRTTSLKDYPKLMQKAGTQFLEPRMRVTFLIVALMMVVNVYGAGVLLPAMGLQFGFDSVSIPLLIVFVQAAGIVMNILAEFLKFPKPRTMLTAGILLMAFGFFISLFPLRAFGVIPLFMIGLGGTTAGMVFWLNIYKFINREYRSTASSLFEQMSSVPGSVVALVVGFMIQAGNLSLVEGVLGGLILMTLIFVRRYNWSLLDEDMDVHLPQQ